MYELDDYVAMVADRLRTPAYLAAMAEVVRPGDRVLDLGTGFGFFAVHACRLGAAHVWAVEPNDAIGLGRAIAAANGCADRITFLQGISQRISLPERVNVLLEDLRGIAPLHLARFEALRDARARLLAPDARRIPLADELVAAPAELPDDLARLDASAPATMDGIALGPVVERLRAAVHRTRAPAECLLAAGQAWARIDLGEPPDGAIEGSLSWVASRGGRMSGLVGWFRAILTPSISFETSPSSGRSVYDRAFLPLPAAIDLVAGDRVDARIRARSDGSDFVWAWEVSVTRAGVRVGEGRASNLASRAISSARRARRAGDHRPARSPAVAALATLVGAVDGSRSLHEIAERLATAHPDRFPAVHDALRWAGERLGQLVEEDGP